MITKQTSINELEFLRSYADKTRQDAITEIAALLRMHKRQAATRLDSWLAIGDVRQRRRLIELLNPQLAETAEVIAVDNRTGLPKVIADSQKPLIQRQQQEPIPERLMKSLLGHSDKPIDRILNLINEVRCARSAYYRKLHERERRAKLLQRQAEIAQGAQGPKAA